MPNRSIPVLVITHADAAASAASLSSFSGCKAMRYAPHRRSPLRRVVTAPTVYERPSPRTPRASRPAPAPPVDVAVRIRATDNVLSLRIPSSSTLDALRSQLRKQLSPTSPSTPAPKSPLALALDDDSVEGWALSTHFHAFLAQAGRNGEPLRLVLH